MGMENARKFRLNENWVSVAIDQLDDFGDVGYLHFSFLDQLLPHCTKEQLLHIERSTKDVDLTPITDKLWKKFYEIEFGGRATDEVIKKMKINNVTLKWSELYQAKAKSMEKDEKEVGDKVKNLCEKEAARRQARQIKVLDQVPPPASSSMASNKKIGSKKQSKISKLRKQYLNSLCAKNNDAMKMMKRSAPPAKSCGGIIRKPFLAIQTSKNVY